MKKTKVFASFLAATLAAFSLSFASPANAAPSQPSNEKTYRVKINAFDADNNQLAKAKFDIKNASGEVVDTFTTTDEAYYAELPVGEYTLVETQAPAGYNKAANKTFTVSQPVRWTDPTIGHLYKAEEDDRAAWYTVTRDLTISEDVNEVVYCVNSDKDSPDEEATYIKRDGSADALVAATSTTAIHQDGEALRSKIMSIVYNGYPTNASNIQGNLTDNQFRSVTQIAIWDTVNNNTDYSDYYLQYGSEKRDAYNKLMEYTENVPDNLEAHMYQVSTDQANQYQSLMGTTFGEIAAPTEVSVAHDIIPVAYGVETPTSTPTQTPTETPSDTEKPNLPNTGANKGELAATGAKIAFPLAFGLIGLGAGLVIRRRMLNS